MIRAHISQTYFGDTRTLRRDYDAERRRVDEQAKALADIARTLALKASS